MSAGQSCETLTQCLSDCPSHRLARLLCELVRELASFWVFDIQGHESAVVDNIRPWDPLPRLHSNILLKALGEPKLTLAQKPAALDPELHSGEVMATAPVGNEVL